MQSCLLSFMSYIMASPTTQIYTLSLHDALPISVLGRNQQQPSLGIRILPRAGRILPARSEEHTSELQSQFHLVCRLLLEKKKIQNSSNDLHVHLRPVDYFLHDCKPPRSE